MSSAPEVSVVVATRDRWHELSRCALPAALRQEDVELELIVVDDGSRDETPKELSEVMDLRLRVMRLAHSGGVSMARNLGLAAARAEWVAFLDDDDLWSPRKLRVQLDAARAAGASFAYAAAVFVDERNRVLRDDPAPPSQGVAAALRASDVVGGPSTVLAQTGLLREQGGFEPSLSVLADWDLWLRLAAAAPGVGCDEVLVAYREHTSNMSAADWRHPFEELELLSKHHGLGRDVDGVRFTHWVAAQQRRAGRRADAAAAYLHGAREFRSPALLARALGVRLGERAMGVPARVRGGSNEPVAAPDWLRAFPQ